MARGQVGERGGVAGGDDRASGGLGVPLTRLGTTGGTEVIVEGQFSVPVEEIRTVWAATLPAALG